MKLIIDLNKINDHEKEMWLLKSLKLMEINFQLNEEPQSIMAYNADLKAGNDDIEQGRFINTESLKREPLSSNSLLFCCHNSSKKIKARDCAIPSQGRV